jgi:hypothetical protein
VKRGPDHKLRHVDFDVVRDIRRIHLDLELAHRLIENSTIHSHSVGHASENDWNAYRNFFTGDKLLEVDVKNLALERVTLNLADQSSRSFPIDIEIYDCALRGDVIEQTLELARVDRERLRLAAVAVHDGRHAALAAKLSRDALAAAVSRAC